jgi:hypothetical protein
MQPRTVTLHAFTRKVKVERKMTPSDDAVLLVDGGASDRQDLLLALYNEICASWRALVDVRFKLLGLVPAVSLALLAALLSRKAPGEGLSDAGGVVVSLLGLTATVALMIYDQRNSQLHDELISRARRIESELKVDVGQFRGRPGSWRFVQHDVALLMVYGGTCLAWLSAAIVFLAGG